MTRYGIIGVFNAREKGKTTFMIKYLLQEVNVGLDYDEAYSNIHIGPDVIDGMHCGHPKIHFIDYSGMMQLKQPTSNGIPRTLLAIDQISNYFDARGAMSSRNMEFSKFIRESRQHGVDIIYTTWMKSEVDKRLRPFTNLLVGAYRTKKGFLYKRMLKQEEDKWKRLKPVTISWAMAREVWKYFDTAELINDPTIPK